jgi:hypothetical protein
LTEFATAATLQMNNPHDEANNIWVTGDEGDALLEATILVGVVLSGSPPVRTDVVLEAMGRLEVGTSVVENSILLAEVMYALVVGVVNVNAPVEVAMCAEAPDLHAPGVLGKDDIVLIRRPTYGNVYGVGEAFPVGHDGNHMKGFENNSCGSRDARKATMIGVKAARRKNVAE